MSLCRDLLHPGPECGPVRRPHAQRGQIMILFAILLPLLVFGAALLVDLALLMRDSATLHATAAAAARAGASEISALGLSGADVFTLNPLDQSSVNAAAQRVCDAYRAERRLRDMECEVHVAWVPDVSGQSAAALVVFGRNDKNLALGPGQTLHMAVQVTARH